MPCPNGQRQNDVRRIGTPSAATGGEGSLPSGPEAVWQQRQRLVGRPARDRQHVVERERLRVTAPPADRIVDVDHDAVGALASMRDTTRPVSAGP